MRDRAFEATNQSRAADSTALLLWQWLRFASRVALERVLLWHQRIEARNRLKTLDDRMLADIGVSRFEVEAECKKPFWKA